MAWAGQGFLRLEFLVQCSHWGKSLGGRFGSMSAPQRRQGTWKSLVAWRDGSQNHSSAWKVVA